MSFKSIAALLGAFVLTVVIWLAWPASEPAPSVQGPEAQAPVSVPSVSTVAALEALAQDPPGDPPPTDAALASVAELEARAERGDPHAMVALARLLSDCADFEPVTPEARDEALAKIDELGEALLRQATGQQDLESALAAVIELGDALAARCAGHELPPISERRQRAEQLSERAALTGNTAAQLEWVAQFRLRWSDPRQVVRKAEQVRVERMRARAYVENGLARREPYALFLQAVAHVSGDLDRIDYARAYAQLRAWQQLGAPGAMSASPMLSQAHGRLRQQLSPEQLNWSEQEADRLAREFSR